MAFQESRIKGVGTDTITGKIMSRNKFNAGHLQPDTGAVSLVEGASSSFPNRNITFGGSFKKGGPVKKTGMYQLHKGEYVLNKRKAMAMKMNDSDALKEYSRTDEYGKKLYRMPEGVYKRRGDRYEREEGNGHGVIHG